MNANRSALTEKQKRILETIYQFQREHGYPPSMREIAALVGLRSPSTVKQHMDVLIEKGALRRGAFMRGWIVVP